MKMQTITTNAAPNVHVRSIPGDLRVAGWDRNELMAKTDGEMLDLVPGSDPIVISCDEDLIIADLEGMPAWRPEAYRVERVAGAAGPPAYRELGVRGTVSYAVLEARPPTHLVLRIQGAGPGFDGWWTFDVAPAPAGARLTITERGEIENPVFRFLSRFLVGHGRAVDAYLEALARHLARAALHIE